MFQGQKELNQNNKTLDFVSVICDNHLKNDQIHLKGFGKQAKLFLKINDQSKQHFKRQSNIVINENREKCFQVMPKYCEKNQQYNHKFTKSITYESKKSERQWTKQALCWIKGQRKQHHLKNVQIMNQCERLSKKRSFNINMDIFSSKNSQKSQKSEKDKKNRTISSFNHTTSSKTEKSPLRRTSSVLSSDDYRNHQNIQKNTYKSVICHHQSIKTNNTLQRNSKSQKKTIENIGNIGNKRSTPHHKNYKQAENVHETKNQSLSRSLNLNKSFMESYLSSYVKQKRKKYDHFHQDKNPIQHANISKGKKMEKNFLDVYAILFQKRRKNTKNKVIEFDSSNVQSLQIKSYIQKQLVSKCTKRSLKIQPLECQSFFNRQKQMSVSGKSISEIKLCEFRNGHSLSCSPQTRRKAKRQSSKKNKLKQNNFLTGWNNQYKDYWNFQ